MADPLSITTGIITLVTVGIQSTSALLTLVQEFKQAPTVVHELKDELSALTQVLESLLTVTENTNAGFAELKLPVQRCSKACQEFRRKLETCAGSAPGARAQFRSWRKLKWLGSDINGFKESIASYKLTISIALANLNLRTSKVTLNTFEEYKEMISRASSDLMNRLETVEEYLQDQASRKKIDEDENADLGDEMLEEKESILACIEICKHVSSNIEHLQRDIASRSSQSQSERVTIKRPAALLVAADQLSGSGYRLEANLSKLRALLKKRYESSQLDAEAVNEEELLEEIESVQQSLQICANANKEADQSRANVMINVEASDDARQVLVSTVGHLIHAQDVKAGARSTQLFGQMSDQTIQTALPRRSAATSEAQPEPEQPDEDFTERFGVGRGLRTERSK